MGAEDGAGGIFRVFFAVIADGCHDFFRVVAWLVSFQGTDQPSAAAAVSGHFLLIIAHGRCRHASGQNGHFSFCLRRLESSVHFLDIRHSAADEIVWKLQTEFIDRLQQNALGFFHPLPDRPVGGLPEVSAFRMLQMGSSCCQCDLHVRDLRAGQDARMFSFFQMGQDQTLPVSVQIIFTARRIKTGPLPGSNGSIKRCTSA